MAARGRKTHRERLSVRPTSESGQRAKYRKGSCLGPILLVEFRLFAPRALRLAPPMPPLRINIQIFEKPSPKANTRFISRRHRNSSGDDDVRLVPTLLSIPSTHTALACSRRVVPALSSSSGVEARRCMADRVVVRAGRGTCTSAPSRSAGAVGQTTPPKEGQPERVGRQAPHAVFLPLTRLGALRLLLPTLRALVRQLTR